MLDSFIYLKLVLLVMLISNQAELEMFKEISVSEIVGLLICSIAPSALCTEK